MEIFIGFVIAGGCTVVLGLCAVLVARITGMMVGDSSFPLVNRLLSILARRR